MKNMSLNNPYQSPASDTPQVSMPEDRERLRRIASAQRLVNIAVLMYIGSIPINVMLTLTGSGAPWVGVALLLYLLAVAVLGAVSVFRLAAIFRGNVVAVIYVVGMLVPLLGLLLLVSLSGKATKALRAAGIKVGLMGANLNSV